MVTNFPLVGGAPLWAWLAPPVVLAAAAGAWVARIEAKMVPHRPVAALPRPSPEPVTTAA